MATVAASTLISRVSTILQDTDHTRWSEAELLGWLNDAQRELVLLIPSASSVTSSVTLTANSSKHTLPADGNMLIDIVRNMGSGGATPGRAIRLVSRDILDSQRPDWHSEAATGTVQNYVYDPRNPKIFYTYPQAPATPWTVEIIYSAAPTVLTSVSSTVSVDDIYANALVDYVIYRAYSKDAEFALNGQLAVAHYQAFQTSIMAKTQNLIGQNPNTVHAGFNPNVQGGK